MTNNVKRNRFHVLCEIYLKLKFRVLNMECKFCHTLFKSVSSLNTHIKNARYCLKLRDSVNNIFICEFCNQSLSSKFRLETHIKSCVMRLNNQLKIIEETLIEIKSENLLLKSENEKLRTENIIYKELSERELSCIEEIAKQPRNQTTNTQNNLFNLTPLDINKESFADTIQSSFTKNYLMNGQKGVAKFAFDNLLKDKDGKLQYICTDPSRQIYRFKTLNGSLERDVKAKKLTSALTEKLIQKSHAIATAEITEGDADVFVLYTTNFQDIKDLVDDNGEFRTELASLTTI